jgi:hypothetical protein
MAVRAEREAAEPGGMVPEGKHLVAARRIPQLDRSVVARRGDPAPVGTVSEAEDVTGVPGQAEQDPARRRLSDFDGPAGGRRVKALPDGRGDPTTVGADRSEIAPPRWRAFLPGSPREHESKREADPARGRRDRRAKHAPPAESDHRRRKKSPRPVDAQHSSAVLTSARTAAGRPGDQTTPVGLPASRDGSRFRIRGRAFGRVMPRKLEDRS